MNRTLKQILVGLSVLIVLPTFILIFFQVTAIDDNEKLIQEVYYDQLDAILFSINQYSQDVVTDWQVNASNSLNLNSKNDNKIENIFINNRPIKCLFILSGDNPVIFPKDAEQLNFYSNFIETLKPEIEKSIWDLKMFEKQGYNKIQPINFYNPEHLQCVFFLLPDTDNSSSILGIIFNTEEFINETLAPKFQEVIKDKFILYVDNNLDSSIVYESEEFEDKNSAVSKPLWVIPSYTIGILLKGDTIDDLISQRMGYNIFLLISTLIVVLVAGIFVFRNIKKEIKLAQLKSDFVSNVSHELKTPLALISMFSETLEMDRIKSEEKKKEYYSIIHRETNRLSRIVSSVLNFSKMEVGKREYSFDEYDINEIIQQIVDTYDYHFRSKGFKCDYQKEILPKISCDKEAISEAIINLIDNAIKYSSSKKEIAIRTGSNKNTIYFEIEDYGIGISHKEQSKVFDKFFRATTGNIHDTKGTGLGLSIVRSIITAHKGEINLTSEVNKGSIFKISLPKTINS
jgi:two-component system, OmpR family, phosphate regulon sensor histidine kinase PhoR